MLSPEVAKERLKEWLIDEDSEDSFRLSKSRFSKAIKALPKHLAKTYLGLYDLDEAGRDSAHRHFIKEEKESCPFNRAAKDFDRLSRAEREQLFAIPFPSMAKEMVDAWDYFSRLPYRPSGSRTSNSDAVLFLKEQWFSKLLLLAQMFQETILEPRWIAAWVPYILVNGYLSIACEVAVLFASEIDKGGKSADDLFEILLQSGLNEHEIGAPGLHVTRGLLIASREEGHEFVEKLLLAAQRQEGLRQSILAAMPYASPEVFQRMLRVVVENDLVRFSAVAMLVNEWFHFHWDSSAAKPIRMAVESAAKYVGDPDAQQEAWKRDDPEQIYFALWGAAISDAVPTIAVAEKLLQRDDPRVRYVAMVHLKQLQLSEAKPILLSAIDDPDVRVALLAVHGTSDNRKDHFEAVERLVARIPEKGIEMKPLVWPWEPTKIERMDVGHHLLTTLPDGALQCLDPHWDELSRSNYCCFQLIPIIKRCDLNVPGNREFLWSLTASNKSFVREAAFTTIETIVPTSDEVQRLLPLFTRKAADVRTAALAVLMKQKDEAVLACTDQLLASKDEQQRLAGLELLRQLQDTKRSVESCTEKAKAFSATRKKLSTEETRQLSAVLKEVKPSEENGPENGWGLMDATKLSPVVNPIRRNVTIVSPSTFAIYQDLDALAHKHRKVEITLSNLSFGEKVLIANAEYGLPLPDREKSIESQKGLFPLLEVCEEWFRDRGKDLRDTDGLEFVRALTSQECFYSWTFKTRVPEVRKVKAFRGIFSDVLDCKPPKLKYPDVVEWFVRWLDFLHPANPTARTNYFLDSAETLFASVPDSAMQMLAPSNKDVDGSSDWRDEAYQCVDEWFDALSGSEESFTPEQAMRWWNLLHWLERPILGTYRKLLSADEILIAYAKKSCNLDDFVDCLIGPRTKFDTGGNAYVFGGAYAALRNLTRRKHAPETTATLSKYPELIETINKIRNALVEGELNRGEAPGPSTEAAQNLQSLSGGSTMLRLLAAIGKKGFSKGSWRSSDKDCPRQTSLTHLLSVTYPAPDEDWETLVKQTKTLVKEKAFPEERLIEMAFLAPQWIKFVEQYYGWEGMAEGMYWFLAHMGNSWNMSSREAAADQAQTDEATNDEGGSEEVVAASDSAATEQESSKSQESSWDRLIKERTPLTAADRYSGAIDVIWFRRVYSVLKEKRWDALGAAARFADNSAQARKAKLIADVLIGRADLGAIIEGIEKRFLKDNVRLLGLYPLPTGAKRQTELAKRFKVLQEYGRYAKKLSGLSKPDAIRSLEIGLKNLASTAGYQDPYRLDWALGTAAWADLREGPVSVETADGVCVTLAIDHNAVGTVTASRAGKPLKAIPAPAKKDEKVATLLERAKELKQSVSRQKQSLEQAMCRGDQFTALELQQLSQHALLAPFLERLVLVGDGIMGYASNEGKALRDHAGKLEPIKKDEVLRIAHPYDLLKSKQWQAWQRDCFQAERVQPFKQVFRELYVVTKQELEDGDRSQRYAGQQINPQQAFALWGQRGWDTKEGIYKVFHQEGVVAQVYFRNGAYTPLGEEGLTLHYVTFSRTDEFGWLPLKEVRPEIFSEVMRDMDLVVSVAHRGGVDPEASASTVEMRGMLVNETCQTLGLKNVTVKGSHVLIYGTLSEYSVHLGSGTVHRQPGGAMCVVPIHSQHRGRLFLPFADDDPRTAEVVSKVLLFARDQEIQDPGILEQLQR